MFNSSIFKPDRYRYSIILLIQLVKTEFKLRYQGSFLGYFWSLLKPLALFAILYVVFANFLKVGSDIPNFPVYLLLGVILWTYFTEVTVTSVESIVSRGDVLRKISFPRYVIVLAGSFSAFINLVLNMFVVFGFMLYQNIDFRIELLLLPLVIAQLFIFSLAVSFFLSAAYVKFRDIKYIWEVLMQGAFYITPILYPVQLILQESSLTVAKLLLLNPMAQIIQDFRYILITENTITIDQLFDGHLIRIVPYGVTLASALIAASYFRSQSRSFAEEL